MTSQELLADEIFNQFDRIGVSTNQDAYSGLMCEYQNLLSEDSLDTVVVKIYDDHADSLYDGQKVLDFLRGVESESLENIWELISEFEV
jgi:hypothetical protein